jgi:hypothetical protein
VETFEEFAQFLEGRKYRESYFAMIAEFLDESFDMGHSGVFAVGGYMARGTAIFELERRWEKLRAKYGLEYFKASQCQRGKGPFRHLVADPDNLTPIEQHKLESISMEFTRAFVEMPWEPNSGLIANGVGVVQDDFYEVINDGYARSVLGDSPYRLAYDFAMIQAAWSMKELGTGDHIAFICDECEQYSPLAYEAYRNLQGTNPNAAKYMGSYSSKDEKKCDPLQAADAVVFEIRRVLNQRLGQRKGGLRKQFTAMAKNKNVFIIQYASKVHLDHIVATHKPGEPFRLDEIMDQRFTVNIGFNETDVELDAK